MAGIWQQNPANRYYICCPEHCSPSWTKHTWRALHPSLQGRETFPSVQCPGNRSAIWGRWMLTLQRKGLMEAQQVGPSLEETSFFTFPRVAVCICVPVMAGGDHLRQLLSADLAQTGASFPPHAVLLSIALKHPAIRIRC